MDLQTLSNLFATTYNSDPNVQKSGELQIRKVRNDAFYDLLQSLNMIYPPARHARGHVDCAAADHRQ